MTKLIGFIGKGGTGKTTLTALFLKYILSKKIKPIMIIDADPNSSLPDLLAVKIDSTIGTIREELKTNIDKNSISKYDYCEYAINNALYESKGYDLIVMGRTFGPGCYCYINNVINVMIEKLKKNYQMIIVDCEAGLEHLSRKTLGDLNTAFIVSDLSRKGILTGIKQAELMNELKINTENNFLIINNVIDKKDIAAYDEIINSTDKKNIKYIGLIQKDKLIEQFEVEGKSLLELPDNSISYNDLSIILDSIKIL